MKRMQQQARRILIGFVGWAVLLAGIIMIPYPGPGWLVVFIGLSILATEFRWAKNTHEFLRQRYEAWQAWLRVQPFYIRAIFWILTCITVVVTIWLLNGYGLLNGWFNLGQDWVQSPFVRR